MLPRLLRIGECAFYWRARARIVYEYEGEIALRFHITENILNAKRTQKGTT